MKFGRAAGIVIMLMLILAACSEQYVPESNDELQDMADRIGIAESRQHTERPNTNDRYKPDERSAKDWASNERNQDSKEKQLTMMEDQMGRMRSYSEQGQMIEAGGKSYFVSIDDLPMKWNVLAEMEGVPELMLTEGNFQIDSANRSFHSSFSGGHQLTGSYDSAGSVTSMTYSGFLDRDPYEALMYWSQIISVTNLNITPNEVDRYFNELNIEPGGNFQHAIGRQIEIHGGIYKVESEDERLVFQFGKSKR